MNNQRIFSGVQPSGSLHIGNYLGAIKNWVELQNKFDAIFCVVDLHAITVPQNPEELKKKTIEAAKIYLAAGIDPEKSTIFIQSHISEHAELAWILNTITKTGDLLKMTQFKDKALIDFKEVDSAEEIGREYSKSQNLYLEEFKNWKSIFSKSYAGLFNYPILMAADILLYDTDVVPVGEDQLQHIELARTLARRFNKKFGETFVVPEPYIQKETMRIMGLDDPAKKMSKSATSEYNYISLTDDEETVRRKIKKAVTDSGSEIIYSDEKPALKNLINIYTSFSGKTFQEIEKTYQGKGYADFKNGLADILVKFLKPFQEKMNAISDEQVLGILQKGAEKVYLIAQEKMKDAKKKVGFIV
ncbi:tryptophan--tRNA ligase [bacterium]|nr:tryptophan--tRNA ligase [bacterium]